MNQKCIEITSKDKCCGCRNCENICPQNAISMVKDSEGFSYPVVDKDKCINCGLCARKCPLLNINKNNEFKKICYAAKSKNDKIQKMGSSGGVFGQFASYIINNDGFVCGAIMTDEMLVKHIITNEKKDLIKLYGSKYVFSDLENLFLKIRKILDDNKLVLFCGVPCQVNALNSFLSKKYDNLITVEIICHGVPSPLLFQKYIKYLENKNNFKILNYEFRNKKASAWGTFKGLITYEKNGICREKIINADFDKYFANFLKAEGYRESCYNCLFASENRNADFTIGDFWGIEKIKPKMLDNNGVSEIIINSKKGVDFFEKIKDNFEYEDVSFEDIIKYNGQLSHPSKRSNKRDSWYKNIDNENEYFKNLKIEHSINDYIKIFIPSNLKNKLKQYLKKTK